MVARLFDTAQPDVLDLPALAELYREKGLRLHAGWRQPMGEHTERPVTLTMNGLASADHLAAELLRLAGVGAAILRTNVEQPSLHLGYAVRCAQDADQALQRALGIPPTVRDQMGPIRLAAPEET